MNFDLCTFRILVFQSHVLSGVPSVRLHAVDCQCFSADVLSDRVFLDGRDCHLRFSGARLLGSPADAISIHLSKTEPVVQKSYQKLKL